MQTHTLRIPIAALLAEGAGLENYTIIYINGTFTVLGIDYNCYETRVQDQPDRRLTLTDQFGSHNAKTQETEHFCNPATIGTPLPDAPPITDSWAHMTWYRIRADLRFFSRVNVTIENQFGANQKMTVETTPRYLMVPTQKIAVDGVDTGLGDPTSENHFTCHQVKGSGQGTRTTVDEFGTENKTLVKPAYLCAPSTKVFGNTTTPSDNLNGAHLVCYQAARYLKSEHTLSVKDQFSTQTLRTRLTGYSCLSSFKTLE